MLIKEIVISFLKEKKAKLMEQYAEWEDMQVEFPEFYSHCKKEMDKINWIYENVCREIYELEGKV